jgi:hypothetical protein
MQRRWLGIMGVLLPLAAIAACADLLGFKTLSQAVDAEAPVVGDEPAVDAGSGPAPCRPRDIDRSSFNICGTVVSKADAEVGLSKDSYFVFDKIELLAGQGLNLDGIDTRDNSGASCASQNLSLDEDGGVDNAFARLPTTGFLQQTLQGALNRGVFAFGATVQNTPSVSGITAMEFRSLRDPDAGAWAKSSTNAVLIGWVNSGRAALTAKKITVFLPGLESDPWLVPLELQDAIVLWCRSEQDGGVVMTMEISASLPRSAFLIAGSFLPFGSDGHVCSSPSLRQFTDRFCTDLDIFLPPLSRGGEACISNLPCNAMSVNIRLQGHEVSGNSFLDSKTIDIQPDPAIVCGDAGLLTCPVTDDAMAP